MQHPPTTQNMAHRRAVRASRGFTLLEILIVVGIIALLLGILLPVLGGARKSAWSAVCQSNLRQASIAWNGYLDDNRFFPFDRPDDLRPSHRWDWGGVNWYDPEETPKIVTQWGFSKRPLNPYYDMLHDHREDAPAFACPADDGLWYAPSLNVIDEAKNDFRKLAKSPDPSTVYGHRGTSYMANQWIWIKPGSTVAFGSTLEQMKIRTKSPYFTSKNSRVRVSNPSLFVLVGDASRFELDRLGGEQKKVGIYQKEALNSQWPHSNWHFSNNNMAFLDGSARAVKIQSNRGVTSSYSWWLQPGKHFVAGGSSIFPTLTGKAWDPRGPSESQAAQSN